jgi:hypothetical protein
MMRRWIRLVSSFFLCAGPLLSGCADIVYTPANSSLNDPDTDGCDHQAMADGLVASCRRLSDGKPLPDAPPFFGVRRRTAVADPYKLSDPPPLLSQFFFEFTPLGLVAPVFDYPPRETVYTGSVGLSFAPAEAARRADAEFEFRTDGAGRFEKVVDFDRGASGVRYVPASVKLRILCRPQGCALSSASDAVSPDGKIALRPLAP